MIDEKKINEAAIAFDNKAEWTEDADAQAIVQYSFKKGAAWALQEFKKSLWHEAIEEPEEYNEWILLRYSVGNYYSLLQVKDFKSWGYFVKKIPIESWCYLSDILPKEGGEG